MTSHFLHIFQSFQLAERHLALEDPGCVHFCSSQLTYSEAQASSCTVPWKLRHVTVSGNCGNFQNTKKKNCKQPPCPPRPPTKKNFFCNIGLLSVRSHNIPMVLVHVVRSPSDLDPQRSLAGVGWLVNHTVPLMWLSTLCSTSKTKPPTLLAVLRWRCGLHPTRLPAQ